MTSETKLLAVTVCLPVLHDLLIDGKKDGSIRYEASRRATAVIDAIDNFSSYMMKGIDKETANDAVDMELWFRQQLQKFEQ